MDRFFWHDLLIWLLVLCVAIGIGWAFENSKVPKLNFEPSMGISSFVVIGGNSLAAVSPPFFPQTQVLGSILGRSSDVYWGIWEIYFDYPDMADGLICLWKEESTYGLEMIGDNGLAKGHFQIHIDKHPEVSLECAMDFSCSLKYTAKQIVAGNGRWWTPFNKCFKGRVF